MSALPPSHALLTVQVHTQNIVVFAVIFIAYQVNLQLVEEVAGVEDEQLEVEVDL